ncbi:MAG: DUF2779 domain-containing protein [Elusimicrobia bacterium]|nr:DUF2779 domain-containing protein [Elusimicrobiota bacterium]MDE2236827.1 DUF2779 domain-containing protein [Elusimicrobiota bacterium]MDE2425386.1 DUF2779 domain-containing protein [Elusimicrobiota bacterium]
MSPARQGAGLRLSKTQYLGGLQCEKALWLHRHRRDLASQPSPGLDAIFEQGAKVGRLAWRRFAGGTLIEADHLHAQDALAATEAAKRGGASILYEAAVAHDGVLVRPDILMRSGASWDLVEVKSSTEVKEVYLEDVAIQRYALNGAGFPIRKCFVMHVNNQYVRYGDIDPKEFFTLADLTDAAKALQKDIPARLARMGRILAAPSAPCVGIGAHCKKPYPCPFIDHCWKRIPEYSVFDLTRIRHEKAAILADKGILRVRDVPGDFPLTEAQELQVSVEKSRKPRIDKKALQKFLAEPVHPLYFLDFETIWPAIPPYDGLSPFQQIPFQASVHVQKAKDGPIEHFEYLGDAKSDPRPGLVEFLTSVIASKGNVVAYNAAFEGRCLKAMADAYPRSGAALRSIKARLWDLMIPFRDRLYVHPGFRGRYTIKLVLPAIVPGMTYKGLAIAEGGAASIAYMNLMDGKLPQAEAKATRDALAEYCGQDTLAMVKVLEHLRRQIEDR